MKHITEKTELDSLASDKPVVVDFWAPWCGPCESIGPAFARIADDLGEEAEFVKVNIDESENLPAQLGIRGIPTFIVFKNGTEVARTSGAKPETALREWIESNI